MLWKPHFTVAAVLEKDGRFLMVEENIDGRLVYNQPAGHIEDDENPLDAVVRETLEETAWHFSPQAIIGIYRWRHPELHETFVRITFSGRGLYHEAARELDDCIERIVWLSPEEIRLQEHKLRSPLVLRSIDDYLAGKSWPLDVWTDIENH